MPHTSIRDRAHQLIDSLSEDATWEDLMEKVHICQAVECGLDDSRNEKTLEMNAVRAQFELEL